MYAYFALSLMGKKPRWRRYVTLLQIVQFVTSVVLFAWTVTLILDGKPCAGQYQMYFNLAFNATLLVQFVSLFKAGDKKEEKKKDVQKAD
jgi:hypothetical protein